MKESFIELNGYISFSSYMITMAGLGCNRLSIWDFYQIYSKEEISHGFCSTMLFCFYSDYVYFPFPKVYSSYLFYVVLVLGGQSIGFAIMAEQCSKTYLAIGLGLTML